MSIILNFCVYPWICITLAHRHILFLTDNNRKFQFRVISNLTDLFTQNSLLILFFSQFFPETRIINFVIIKLFFDHFEISSKFIDNLIFLLDVIMVLLNYTFMLFDFFVERIDQICINLNEFRVVFICLVFQTWILVYHLWLSLKEKYLLLKILNNLCFFLVVHNQLIKIAHILEWTVFSCQFIYLILHWFKVFNIFYRILSLEVKFTFELNVPLVNVVKLLKAILRFWESNWVLFEQLLYFIH